VSTSDLTTDKGLLSGHIYDSLRAQIIGGQLDPGERLVESDIARTLEVSQSPVRDALKRLSHEGLVLHLPRRGNFVASISEEEAKRSYRVRESLEDVAAREFCAYAESSSIDELYECISDMRRAAQEGDQAALIDADVRFHRIVWASSENPLLPMIFPMVEATIRKFTAVSNRLYFDASEVAESHVPLVESLVSRDPDRAAEVHRAHVREVWERIGQGKRQGSIAAE
jgi:DNA-binding GntR family transcriptional regulator